MTRATVVAQFQRHVRAVSEEADSRRAWQETLHALYERGERTLFLSRSPRDAVREYRIYPHRRGVPYYLLRDVTPEDRA